MVRKQRRTTRNERREEVTRVRTSQGVAPFPRFHLAPVLLLTALAYANTLGNGFVLDDIGVIVENPLVRNGASVGAIFTSSYWPGGSAGLSPDPTLYRPLTILSYALNAGPTLNTTAFHVINIALHLIATALVFLLAWRLFASDAAALAAASVSAVHPVHTESVSGIVGRADVMATLFFLAAFLLLRRRAAFATAGLLPALGWSVLGAFLWLCGLLSKEIAATLPVVLAVDDWLARGEFPDRVRTVRLLLVRYVPLGVAAIMYMVLREHAVAGDSHVWPGFADVSTLARIMTASRVTMEYVRLFLYPVPLLADYWISEVAVASSLLNPAVLASIALWIVTAVALVRAHGDTRIVLPIAWFFITLAPVSNIFFPIGVAKAERLLYLPSVGLCVLLGWAAAVVARRAATHLPGRIAFGVAVLALMLLTVRRNKDWKDNLTLAQATLAISPESPLMNDVAAGELMKQGHPQRALSLLQEATRQAPNLSFPHAHLGAVYAALGMRVESEAEYLTALRLNPQDASTHNNLGVLYLDTGREDLALEQLRSAIAIQPDFADARSNLGALHLGQGKLSDAAAELAESVRLNPGSADARNNYGLVLFRLGRRDEAAEQYREALRLDPNHQKARANLSALEQSRKDSSR